jgi:hypothetical protein
MQFLLKKFIKKNVSSDDIGGIIFIGCIMLVTRKINK